MKTTKEIMEMSDYDGNLNLSSWEYKEWYEVSDVEQLQTKQLANWEAMRVYVAQEQIRYGDNLHLQEMYEYCNERIEECNNFKGK